MSRFQKLSVLSHGSMVPSGRSRRTGSVVARVTRFVERAAIGRHILDLRLARADVRDRLWILQRLRQRAGDAFDGLFVKVEIDDAAARHVAIEQLLSSQVGNGGVVLMQ